MIKFLRHLYLILYSDKGVLNEVLNSFCKFCVFKNKFKFFAIYKGIKVMIDYYSNIKFRPSLKNYEICYSRNWRTSSLG